MKIAIVGSGIAGLAAAHRLHGQHQITVFEQGSHVGGHVHTHDVRLDGRDFAVDTGFIVHNDRTYPHFTGLLDELGVKRQASDMGFSVSCSQSGLEYCGSNLNALFAQRSNLARPTFWRMLRDIFRFNREAPALLEQVGADQSLGTYLDQEGYGSMFRDHYILPMGAAIWSTDPVRVAQFPARFFIRFFLNHGLLSINDQPVWYVIEGGSRRYVEKLIAPFADSIRLNSPVRRIRRSNDQVTVCLDGGSEVFDAVFLACHSDQALSLLEAPSRDEEAVLGAIPYQANEAVLHTDTRLLPKRRRAWAAWNYLMPEGPQGRVCLTYDMNILQGLDAPETFCVTLNATELVDPDRIISRMTYHHPLFTLDGISAQQKHRAINGTCRTYYCGAWWRNGFHEDGMASALHAVHHFEDDHAKLPVRRLGQA
ncbi:MAG: FAD-dependent oxidoreductase [Betaproteobacteria bacterium]|nr:FAD-dependent oxidoreductase [Betaproteobacteria bacterium]MDE2622775.1 FAD-dependent oxidoreductase [Betaproteobacteria bacterium]